MWGYYRSRVVINIFAMVLAQNKSNGPKTLIPKDIDKLGVQVFGNMIEGLRDIDVVMVLRLSKKNGCIDAFPLKESIFIYGLDDEKMKYAKFLQYNANQVNE